MIVYVILSIPTIIALCVLLRQASQSFVAVYLALSFVGITSFISARPVFEMLSFLGKLDHNWNRR
jgi:hypothetical protein